MQASLHLNSRQQQVLRATVQHYVATVEPVGSKVLTQEYDLKVSPATVRNVMGFLEKSGLLYQPHPSAGRVPSDSGYRLYVDQLIHPSQGVARRVDGVLSTGLDWEGWSLEALLRGAAQVLATLSGYLTLITVPQKGAVEVRHLQLVQVEPGQVLLVVLLESLETQSMLIRLPADAEDPSRDEDALDRELQILSNFLSAHLRGRSLAEVANLDWGELGREFQQYADAVCGAMSALARRTQPMRTAPFVISGLAEVLRQPEFSETQHVQAIVHLLEEEQAQIWPLVFESGLLTESRRRVRVWIGSENPLEPMQTCALVSSPYTRDNVPVGSVSVLGPTRMVYEDAIAVVEAAADYLSEALLQLS